VERLLPLETAWDKESAGAAAPGNDVNMESLAEGSLVELSGACIGEAMALAAKVLGACVEAVEALAAKVPRACEDVRPTRVCGVEPGVHVALGVLGAASMPPGSRVPTVIALGPTGEEESSSSLKKSSVVGS
jgi:hypothetical protein